jgi:hypothetical protein
MQAETHLLFWSVLNQPKEKTVRLKNCSILFDFIYKFNWRGDRLGGLWVWRRTGLEIFKFGQKVPSQGALTGALTGAPLLSDAQVLKIRYFFALSFSYFLKSLTKKLPSQVPLHFSTDRRWNFCFLGCPYKNKDINSIYKGVVQPRSWSSRGRGNCTCARGEPGVRGSPGGSSN